MLTALDGRRSAVPRRALVAAALCVGLLGLSACTDAQGTAPPTEGQRTTTQTTPPSTSPPPTPAEEAAAAALDTVVAYWGVQENASQKPAARNWESELRRYGDEAITAKQLSGIQFSLQSGIRQVGEYTLEPEVTSVDLANEPHPVVTITACFDSTTARAVDAETGEDTPDPPPDLRPKFPRWKLRVTVLQYADREGSPWLVHDVKAFTGQPC